MKTPWILGFLTILALNGVAFATAPTPPNILFILIDDLGWADVGCFGSRYYKTPAVDRLAAQGMKFTQAYAACAVCSPTRAAILTGKAPARLHITDWIAGEGAPKNSRFLIPDWQQNLPLEETTLAESLKDQGYATGHIGKWHLGGAAFSPKNHGFDLNVAGGDIGHPASYFWPYGKEGASHRVPGLAERGGREGEYLTDQLTDEAIKFIQDHRNGPFYLQLWHYTVHSPLMGKPGLVDEFERQPGSNGQSNAVYAAMVRSMDDSIGRILNTLEDLHLSDHTIVVFTSDNGGAVHFGKPPATSNLPLRSGKGFAYEGGLRVPLLLKVPGVTQPGTTCTEPVISCDFFPTLLELAGAPAAVRRKGVDGTSLVPLLRGKEALPHRSLCWHYPHYWNGGAVSPYSVIREDSWKLIRVYESGREELYNLAADPSEQRDVAPAEPARLRKLGRKLDTWLRETGAQLPVERQKAGEP